MKKTSILALALATAAASAAPEVPEVPVVPTPKNPGFEHGGLPWKFQAAGQFIRGDHAIGTLPVGLRGDIDRDVARSHRKSYRIDVTDADATGRAVLEQTIDRLPPGRTYRVSAWTRGQDAPAASLAMGRKDGKFLAPDLEAIESQADALATAALPTGTYDWTETTVDFTAGPEQRVAVIALLLDSSAGGDGTIYLDDVRLNLSPDEPPRLGEPTVEGGATTEVRLEKDRYEALELVEGTVAQSADEPLPAATVTLRLDGPTPRELGTVELPATEAGQSRSFDFALPLQAVADGEYRVVASVGDKTIESSPFEKIDVDAALIAQAAEIEAEADELRDEAAAAGFADDPYLQLGLSVIDRFTERVATRGPDGNQDRYWQRFQVEELGRVLERTRETLDALERGVERPGTVVRPGPGRIDIDGETVTLDVTRPDGSVETAPYFLYGYGHFIKAHRDIPDFWDVGSTMIQQGNGPDLLDAEGKLPADAGGILDAIDDAQAANLKIDYVVGEGVPRRLWAQLDRETEDTDLFVRNVGFIPLNIDHPLVKEWEGRYAQEILPVIADSGPIVTACLSNEPAYAWSGRDRYSRPLFDAYLEQKHGTIDALNDAYGTDYAAFGDVPVPVPQPIEPYTHVRPDPSDTGAMRAYYDWLQFHQAHFTAWHARKDALVNSLAPDLKTHVKAVGPAAFNPNVLHWGVNPEDYADFTDIAGLDSHFWPSRDEDDFGFEWLTGLMSYDLFNSYRDQPVFNSENHLLRDGQRSHALEGHLRLALWEGAMHHQRLTTQWVWEEPVAGSLEGNVSLRPASVYDAGLAMYDLARLNAEADALASMPEQVAILFSPTSLIWQPGFERRTKQMYASLAFLGGPVTFVTERHLAENRVPENVKAIVMPDVTHIRDDAVAGLERFVEGGGGLISPFGDAIKYDEYGDERDLPDALAEAVAKREVLPEDAHKGAVANALMTGPTVGENLVPLLREAGVEVHELAEADGDGPLVFGVMHRRTTTDDGRTLVAVSNLLKESKTVTIPDATGGVDLLTGERVDPSRLELPGLTPMLIELDSAN